MIVLWVGLKTQGNYYNFPFGDKPIFTQNNVGTKINTSSLKASKKKSTQENWRFIFALNPKGILRVNATESVRTKKKENIFNLCTSCRIKDLCKIPNSDINFKATNVLCPSMFYPWGWSVGFGWTSFFFLACCQYQVLLLLLSVYRLW